MALRSTTLIEDKDEDLVLEFCTTVLGLSSLHWGFWKENEAITLDNLRKAQSRFSEVLRANIPSDVHSILDIGCGVGDNAKLFAQHGYSLTCLSPDLNHKKAFDFIKDKNILFHHGKIETFSTTSLFDMVLMSESAHYFDKDVAFKQFQSMIRPNGYILVAGLFRKRSSKEYAFFHVEKEWLKSANNHGFKVVGQKDITSHVLPTSKLGGHLLENNLIPGTKIISRYMKRRTPIAFFLLRIFFKKQLRELEEYFRIGPIPEMFNPVMFEKKAKYMIYVLQKK